MATMLSDIRTSVRDYLHEATADLFTDVVLSRRIVEEVRSLPKKQIYKENVRDVTITSGSVSYDLPSTVVKVEDVLENIGTTDIPSWIPFIVGFDFYNGTMYLKSRVSKDYSLRLFCKEKFAELVSDSTVTDIPDEKLEVVVLGSALRALRSLGPYLMNSNNYDTSTRPNAPTISQLTVWLSEAKKDYNDALKTYRTVPKPREVNMLND